MGATDSPNCGITLFKCVIYAIIGILLGSCIDNFIQMVAPKNERKCALKYALITCQLFLGALVSTVIQCYVAPSFTDEWQGNVPGMFFVAFFFGVQFGLFSRLSSVLTA